MKRWRDRAFLVAVTPLLVVLHLWRRQSWAELRFFYWVRWHQAGCPQFWQS